MGAEACGELRAVLPEGTGPPAAVPPSVFAAAVTIFLAGRRLDMQALARHLRVSRATLYRRAGNREELLDAVIWWRARRMVARQLQLTDSLRGADRIMAVIAGALRAIESDRPLRAFVAADPDAALRILTGGRSAAAGGMTAALGRLIERERSRGCFAAELDPASLAYAVTRISEGFLYADVLADRPPDIERAITVIRALLTGLDRAPARSAQDEGITGFPAERPAGHGWTNLIP